MKITCVVDNQVVEGSGLKAEHGLSFWIECDSACVLFDTGQSVDVLAYNLAKLNIPEDKIKIVALSHAHYDHTGGLNLLIREHNHPLIYANPDFLTPRYALRENEYQFIGMPLSQEQLLLGTELVLSDCPCEILPGLWTSGQIVSRPETEGRNANHFVRCQRQWLPDPYLDDMSLVAQTERGLVLICGCCHAGLLNTLEHVSRLFNAPVRCVLGGIHLKPADEQTIDRVVDTLQNMYPGIHCFLNHCSGERAINRLSESLKDQARPFPAGSRVDLDQDLE